MNYQPEFKVRLSAGGSITVKGESYQPFEPAAYCWESYWEAFSETDNEIYFVYMVSGIVSKGIERPNESTDTEIEVGYVLSILRENQKMERIEADLIAREKNREV